MHLQTLSSGSRGNATLVRSGELGCLVDCGLSLPEMERRFEAARVAPRTVDHVVLTHGHLDHARSAGRMARKCAARVHCAPTLMGTRSLKRAPSLSSLPIGGSRTLEAAGEPEGLLLETVPIPHDAHPTVALGLSHAGRRAVVLTDMGRADSDVARRLSGAHLILIEFNHDSRMLAEGDDPPALKRRIAGDGGHLSNDQAARMLEWMAGPELHTVVLAHLSSRNNTPAKAEQAARTALVAAGLEAVRIVVADQDEVGPNLAV